MHQICSLSCPLVEFCLLGTPLSSNIVSTVRMLGLSSLFAPVAKLLGPTWTKCKLFHSSPVSVFTFFVPFITLLDIVAFLMGALVLLVRIFMSNPQDGHTLKAGAALRSPSFSPLRTTQLSQTIDGCRLLVLCIEEVVLSSSVSQISSCRTTSAHAPARSRPVLDSDSNPTVLAPNSSLPANTCSKSRSWNSGPSLKTIFWKTETGAVMHGHIFSVLFIYFLFRL